jgi:hypothetical protein
VDLACRNSTDWDLFEFLELGVEMMKCKNDLGQGRARGGFSHRQHIKAYTSAMASWIKVYIVNVRKVAAAAAAVPLQAAGTVVNPTKAVDDLELMVDALDDLLRSLGPAEVPQSCEDFDASKPLEADILPMKECADRSYRSSNTMVLLVWTARAVAEMAQQLLNECGHSRTAADCSETSNGASITDPNSNSSSGTSSSSGDSEGASSKLNTCTEVAPRSGHDMQGADSVAQGVGAYNNPVEVFWHVLQWCRDCHACHMQQLPSSSQLFGIAADSTAQSSSSGSRESQNSSSGTSTGTSSSSASSGTGSSCCSSNSPETVRHHEKDVQGTGAAQQKILNIFPHAAIAVVLLLVERLLKWHSAATADHEPAATPDTKQAGNYRRSHPNESVVPSNTPPMAAVHAVRRSPPAGAPPQQQARRPRFKLPNQGLPSAVAEALKRLKGRFSSDDNEGGQIVKDPQLQLMVLQDGIDLCKLLQQRPNTPGSNPFPYH